MRISSSMISWNEASTIDLTLKSVVGFADEVIIIDTGSFDGTRKIAREWMDRLGLSGQIKRVNIKTLGEARVKSLQLCSGDWILMQDSDLVLSNSTKTVMKGHAKKNTDVVITVRSVNLMGDYDHYFKHLPMQAPHRIFARRDQKWDLGIDRPHFRGREKQLWWAVNLSRVRPAWRCWYRGEPFDPRYHKKVKRGFINEANIQRSWMESKQYPSIREYVDAEMGLTLDDVKSIAPEWYLDQLQRSALPLTAKFRDHLPEVIKTELKSPRYKLIYEEGKIVGRQPEL